MSENYSLMYQPGGASPLRSHTSRAIAILALLFWSVCPTFLFAQVSNQPTPSSNQPPEDREVDSIEQLKRKVAQIHKQYRKELSELQERLGSVEKRQSTLADEIGQHVKLGGYGFLSFEDFQKRKTTYDGKLELLISG